MANSYQEYTGDGATVQFSFTKPYLREAHVQVFIDGTEDTSFTFVNPTLVQTSTTPAVDATVRVQRTTPTTPIVDWEDGSTVREEDQDDATLQSLYIAEESADNLTGAMRLDTDGKYDATSDVIKNVADGVAAQDAATKAQLDAAVLAAGNVPTPVDPTDDGKVLAASGGAFSWTSFLVSMISDAASFMKTFLLSSTAADARTNLGLGGLSVQSSVDGTDIVIGSDASGDILYRGASNYQRLAKGSDGEVLTLASGLPSWVAAAAGASGDVQSFTSSGTWNKPSSGSIARIQCWGAGGSGAARGNNSTNRCSGGGGGGYKERWMLLSDLGATETVTIGAGGAGVSANANGNIGGNTTFGSHVTAYGGGAGLQSSSNNISGGSGGGELAAGSLGTTSDTPGGSIGGGDGILNNTGEDAKTIWGGGAGGGSAPTTARSGGNAVYGGGGGSNHESGATGGTSLYGGDGGGQNAAGSQPGGASGGGTSASLDGGDGQVIVTVF